MKDLKHIKVWELGKNGKKIKVATVEQGPRKPSMCDGCPAPCCQGIFRPILNSEEFLSKKFPMTFMDMPEYLKKKDIEVEKIAVLAFTDSSQCNYFDPASGKCTIWPNCPKSCLAYDCREDPRLKEFAKKREGELKR